MSQSTQPLRKLPRWARDSIRTARAEAARYRRQADELRQQYGGDPEELEERLKVQRAQLEAEAAEIRRKLIAAEAGLSPELWEFVTGDDPEQQRASAARLSTAVQSPPKR